MQLPKIKSKHLDFLILYLSLLFFSGYYFFETMTTPGVILVGGLLLLRAAKIQALDKRTAYFFLIMISNVVITELIGTIAYDMPLKRPILPA